MKDAYDKKLVVLLVLLLVLDITVLVAYVMTRPEATMREVSIINDMKVSSN